MKRGTGVRQAKEVVREQKVQVARLLLSGHGPSEIAKKMDLGRETVWKWRNRDPEFTKIFEEMQKKITDRVDDAMLRTVVGQLQDGAEKGLRFMVSVLDDPEASRTEKQRAATDLMDRDERMQKKRTVTAKQTHEVIPAEILALAAVTAQALRGAVPVAALPSSSGPVIEAEVADSD